MSIRDEADLKGIIEASRVARHLRELLQKHCVPGTTTVHLEDLCRRELRALGAVSAPQKYYQAPSAAFYSVNHCVVHGLPSRTELAAGDLVKIDVTPEYHGYIADTACTVVVGAPNEGSLAQKLASTAKSALDVALAECLPGRRVRRLGRAIEKRVNLDGFFVFTELTGHGVGRAIHEEPSVPNYEDPRVRDVLTEGLVIAIEPMIAHRRAGLRTRRDGWSIEAPQGTLTAHHEHTVLITAQGPVVLT